MRNVHWLFLLIATYHLATVKSFSIWKILLAPSDPLIRRVHTLEEARAMGPSTVLDFLGLVQQYDYQAEEHYLTTEDGYNFVLHRITGSPRLKKDDLDNKKKKGMVLLQHGILCSSDCWVLRGPEYDLAFLLADAGYDVWVGNFRGNYYGRSHQTMSPNDKKFWDYSFHEHSIYDLKRIVDYMEDHTGQNGIIYIGHSMGTTMSYVLLSELPEYNDKFRLIISLSPIASWAHGVSPAYQILIDNSDMVMNFLKRNEIYELGTRNYFSKFVGNLFCKDKSVWQPLCISVFFSFAGNDPQQLNTTFLSDVFSYYPAGSSLRTIQHYLQNIRTKRFDAYDYGPEENMQRYNQTIPPAYQLDKVSANTAIFYGDGDVIAIPQNVKETAKQLGNVVLYEKVPWSMFNHFDFMWAMNAKELLYDRVMELMEKY